MRVAVACTCSYSLSKNNKIKNNKGWGSRRGVTTATAADGGGVGGGATGVVAAAASAPGGGTVLLFICPHSRLRSSILNLVLTHLSSLSLHLCSHCAVGSHCTHSQSLVFVLGSLLLVLPSFFRSRSCHCSSIIALTVLLVHTAPAHAHIGPVAHAGLLDGV